MSFIIDESKRDLFEEAAPFQHIASESCILSAANELAALQASHCQIDFVERHHKRACDRPDELTHAAFDLQSQLFAKIAGKDAQGCASIYLGFAVDMVLTLD